MVRTFHQFATFSLDKVCCEADLRRALAINFGSSSQTSAFTPSLFTASIFTSLDCPRLCTTIKNFGQVALSRLGSALCGV
jgi:hypothetical protein